MTKFCKGCEQDLPKVNFSPSTAGYKDGLRQLCKPCNRGLGLLKEDPEVLTTLIGYLEKHV